MKSLWMDHGWLRLEDLEGRGEWLCDGITWSGSRFKVSMSKQGWEEASMEASKLPSTRRRGVLLGLLTYLL
jgi:hypothetical protein